MCIVWACNGKGFDMTIAQTFVLMVSVLLWTAAVSAGELTVVPTIEGDWWTVAHNPNIGDYTREGQQPVDFAVWQAADGTWQLWSCIRNTKLGGHTRLFHRWEGKNLTDTDWEPKGIALEADPSLGEPLGGLQAPHVVRWNGLYHMVYGDWEHMCFATSEDGKEFTRRILPDGTTGVFTEGPGQNTRDPVLLFTKGKWHMYYTAFPRGKGYVFCRTSPDLHTWSDGMIVAYGGRAGNNPFSCECPHVVETQPGLYHLFRTQMYGEGAQTSVYQSRNPYNFGIDDDHYFVCTLPVAAPEIILHEGHYYIAALLPSLQGIQIAPFTFQTEEAVSVFDFDSPEARARWRIDEGDLPEAFTTSTRSNFYPPMRHFIGTAELPGDSQAHDEIMAVIESPEFTVESKAYTAMVSGGVDAEQVYVALIDARTGDELWKATGNGGNHFGKVRADWSNYLGKRVMLRVVDQSQAPWCHINFGGLYALKPVEKAP